MGEKMIPGKKGFIPVLALSFLALLTPFASAYSGGLEISPSTSVSVNTTVTATVVIDDPPANQAVFKIVFKWINPRGATKRIFTITSAPFRDQCTLDEPGEWVIEVEFSNGIGRRAFILVFISMFVVPEMPLGSITAVLIPLLAITGIFNMRRLKITK